MTSILSTISGQFTKSLIFATVIPVILFVVLSVTFVGPLAPQGWQTALAPLQAMETEWKVLALTVAVVALSGLLYNLNTPVIRLYAGYPWKDSFVGLPRVRYYQRKYRAHQARWRGLRTLTRALDEKEESEALNRLSGEMNRIGLRLYQEFPKDPGLVLPTRLGNVIDRKSTRLNSSHANISYAVFCLKKKKNHQKHASSQYTDTTLRNTRHAYKYSIFHYYVPCPHTPTKLYVRYN